MVETWIELEQPVLSWVLKHGNEGTGALPYDSGEPFAGIPELTETQVAKAIKRLQQHGLVVGDGPSATNTFEDWRSLRPTADGLRVLGEWPPADSATINEALARILRTLAESDNLPSEEKSAARRAAGTLASMGGDVVMDVAKAQMRQLPGGAG